MQTKQKQTQNKSNHDFPFFVHERQNKDTYNFHAYTEHSFTLYQITCHKAIQF